MTESVADITRRVFLQQNFQVPRTYGLSALVPADIALPCSGFTLGAGAVTLSGNTISSPQTYFSSTQKVANSGIYKFYGSLTPGITQGYVDPSSGQLATRATQTSGVFPANCLPIFEATVDSASLIRSLVDWRPSYL